ncbi:MAG: hypothetical protein HYT66_01215 [Candidatus Yanofskybacteria bacterium]|nr:hypothetical protein [Candidatus Yanofskybacteria bacterium]
MPKNIKKNMTVDDLAEMVAKGFADTATKEDLNAVKFEVKENTRKLSKIEVWMEDLKERLDEVEKGIDSLKYTIVKQQNKRIERLESELDRVKKFLPA